MFGRFLVCAALIAGVVGVPAQKGTARYTSDFDGPRDVTLYFFTQNNPTEAEFITYDDSTSPSFNPANPTRVVAHGWVASVEKLLPFKEAYISTGEEYNIILVDWSGPAGQGITEATKGAVLAGDYAGKVLKHLVESRGLDPDTLIVIGHSMGGHVAGVIANRVGGDLVSEVVALDPAANIFDANPLEDRLDITDAKFVQVIHTNDGGAGTSDSIGHADFFPNGGSYQVGCGFWQELLGCSHNRVVDYYVESINSNGFVASLCSSYDDYANGACSSNDHAVMGEKTPHNKTGRFYLATNKQAPFAQGETGL